MDADELERQERAAQGIIDKLSSLALSENVDAAARGEIGPEGAGNDGEVHDGAFDDDMDDEDMMKMFDGGDDDDALIAGFADETAAAGGGGAGGDDDDVDDDALLERLENQAAAERNADDALIAAAEGKGKAKPAPVAAPAKAAPAPKASAASATTVAAAAPAAVAAAAEKSKAQPTGKPAAADKPAAAGKPASTGKAPAAGSGKTPAASTGKAPAAGKAGKAAPTPTTAAGRAAAEATRAAYADVTARLTANIAALTAHVKAQLVQKQLLSVRPSAGSGGAAGTAQAAADFTAAASRGLALKRVQEQALEKVAALEAQGAPAPLWALKDMVLQSELCNEDVPENTLRVTVRSFAPSGAAGGKLGGDKLTVHVSVDMGAAGPPATAHTGWAKATDAGAATFDTPLSLPVPAGAQRTMAVKRALRALRVRVDLKKKGRLWGTNDVGVGEWRVGAALLTAVTAEGEARVKTENDETVGAVVLSLAVHRPLEQRQFVSERVSLAAVAFNEPGGPAEGGDEDGGKAARAAMAAATATLDAAAARAAPKTAAAAATPAAAAAGAKAAAAPAEEEPDSGPELLKLVGITGVDWGALEVAGQPQATPSFDALNKMKEDAEAAVGKLQGKAAAEQKEIVEDCGRMLMFFEVAVGTGKLSLEDYLDALRAAIALQKTHIPALAKLAKHFHSRGDAAKFKEYSERAKALLAVVGIMESEVKTAEENMDELE